MCYKINEHMKLKIFVEKLQKIGKAYGEDAEVVMADFVPVVGPVFLTDKRLGDKVVITDKK